MKQCFEAVAERWLYVFLFCRAVPVGGGGYAAGIGREPNQDRVAAILFSYKLTHI